MSRNLGQTYCYFCRNAVVLEEKPRKVTREEVGPYYDTHHGFGYAGAIVAKANCPACEAKYLAWVDLRACDGYGGHDTYAAEQREKDPDYKGFFDLSFRSSFNDEPDEEDLPNWVIKKVELTPTQCQRLEAFSGTILRREPWPRCCITQRKVYHCYGCRCGAHR